MEFIVKIIKASGLFIYITLCVGCAGNLVIPSSPKPEENHHTTVVFMVDGLSGSALQEAMRSGRMQYTQSFFLGQQRRFALARAAFPSLTYPNIASLLTARKVGEQPIISNKMVKDGEIVNFETVKSHKELRELIDPNSIFGVLDREGSDSASFSYIFGLNAREHMKFGLAEGLDYQNHDYHSLDQRLLENMKSLLDRREPNNWPRFLYVHLVGVDGTSHRFGAKSPQAMRYLAWLDKQLASVYRRLRDAEQSGHVLHTLMTADHGFTETPVHVDVEEVVHAYDKRILVTNEARFLGLYFPKGIHPEPLLKILRKARGVAFTATVKNNLMRLEARNLQYNFVYGPALCSSSPFSLALLNKSKAMQKVANYFQCPEYFRFVGDRHFPFLIEDLAGFFQAPRHPDALIVAQDHVSFEGENSANHGGATAEEMFVPLLTRNFPVPQGIGGVPRTSDLLRGWIKGDL